MTDTPPANTPLHDVVATAFVRAREALRPHDVKQGDQRLAGWLDAFEDEMAAALRPHLEPYIGHPDIPPEVSDLFAYLVAPEHATASSILFAVVGAAFYPLVSSAMEGPAQGIRNTSFSHFPDVPLSPAEVALADIRGALHGINPQTEVANSGINPGRYAVLHDITGEPPAIEQLLLLYRRGQIDLARLVHGILQSRIRNEWVDAVEMLRFAPPPAGEVVAGALKGHLSDADAQTKLGEAGIDPVNFAWMKATAGRPPGLEQMLELWNRQVATEADVDDAVRQSDINDRYLPFVKELRKYFPPPRSVVPMLRSGSITEAQARTLLSYYGVAPEWVDAFIGEAKTTKQTTAKDLTQAQVIRLYSAQLIDRATATARLEAHGMTPADVTSLLDYADQERHERFQSAILTRVHSRYVGWKIDDAGARAALSRDQVPAAAIDDYMQLWAIERDTNRPGLTTAELLGAYRRGKLDQPTLFARLQAAGWNAADLPILEALAFPPTAFKSGPAPP